MRKITVILTLSLLAAAASAQTTQKIGYADWEYIFGLMPEFKQIEAELKTHGEQLQNTLKAKSADLEAKIKAYQGMSATTPDAIRSDKERELQGMQEGIQKFQQEAQSSLQKKQADLMEPIYKKVGKAIEEVAKEQSYSFIINPQMLGGGDILLYSDDKYNISDLVLKKLGITPTAAQKAQATKPQQK